ncbi:hypothetical protein AAFF_G00024330 [Aldrovandia affinis]|uniref:Uncharacterized protein n=1 Tax=Aldrovandia affinis TaxID=143900 RepID=A0AAD7T5W5_9TELE|nr:hypothetical protein AAFF_G00024330 [Aldrovandia affinis]
MCYQPPGGDGRLAWFGHPVQLASRLSYISASQAYSSQRREALTAGDSSPEGLWSPRLPPEIPSPSRSPHRVSALIRNGRLHGQSTVPRTRQTSLGRVTTVISKDSRKHQRVAPTAHFSTVMMRAYTMSQLFSIRLCAAPFEDAFPPAYHLEQAQDSCSSH